MADTLGQEENTHRMLKKASLLTRLTPARQDAPFRGQGRSSEANPRFTFYVSRFTAHGSEARTPLVDFFSILLMRGNRPSRIWSDG